MMRMRSLRLVLAAAVLAACAGQPAMPDSDAEVTGTVAELLGPSAADYALRMVVAENAPEPRDRSIVHLRRSTPVYVVEAGGRIRRGEVDDLAPGDRVQVWTTGVELRSYPVQVFAVRIHLLR